MSPKLPSLPKPATVPSSAVPAPLSIPELLLSLRTLNPTSPRLTWYGSEGERVELSGRVFDNWVAKTANLLVDELDAQEGTTVALDLPVHWRSLIWLLSIWAVRGTAVITENPTGHADIVATTDPDSALHAAQTRGDSPLIVAVELPALAMGWSGVLPTRVLDYAGEVRSYSDVFFPEGAAATDAPAWESPTSSHSYGELFDDLAAAPSRILIHDTKDWDEVVPQVIRIWAAGGSVVLVDSRIQDTSRIRQAENII